jgi:hypothetical protein
VLLNSAGSGQQAKIAYSGEAAAVNGPFNSAITLPSVEKNCGL